MSKPEVRDGAASSTSSAQKAQEPRAPWWKRLWQKSGLNIPTCMIMFKGAAAPVTALSLFQFYPYIEYFTSIGFLVAIVVTLSFPILPRAKFMQTMLFNTLGLCLGACVNLLTCLSAVKAREHTSPPMAADSAGPTPGAMTAPYNSSASAVAGVWLFFNVMFANAVRFKFPQFQSCVIIYSINAIIAAIYAPQFPNWTAAETFVKKLLIAFFSGFGIATVVNLFVFPITSRRVVQAQYGAYLGALKQVMAAERDYLQSMESHGPNKDGGKGGGKFAIESTTKDLKESVVNLTVLHSKVAQDLIFAKREIALGKLTAKDLDKVFKLFRSILLPCLGISSVADIFQRVAEGKGWTELAENPASDTDSDVPLEHTATREAEKEQWSEIMRSLHDPFRDMVEAISEALSHVGYALEFTSKPKSKGQPSSSTAPGSSSDRNGDDVEAKAGTGPIPGDESYGKHLLERMRTFSQKNKAALLHWCEQKGLTEIPLPTEVRENPFRQTSGSTTPPPAPNDTQRRQLYMILYLEFLLYSTAKAVLDLVQFADEKVASGQMKKTKLIVPGSRRLKKWLLSCFIPEDSDGEHTPDSVQAGMSNLNLPKSFRRGKDPEHLPPMNAWQRFGEGLRKVASVFRSQEVAFGFRVACGTMSVAIIGYLRQTQKFFVYERLFWAQIMVAISMTITSGSGIFAFAMRILGTFLACIVALVIWYISGGRGIPGALMPLLFLVYLPLIWGIIRYPRYLPVFQVMMITLILILGYELEADALGLQVLQLNGQNYHPIYIFAWIRMATVAAGLAIAFFWMYVPYPLTAKNAMRKRLSDSIFLLASYYSCVHATIGLRIENCGGDPEDKGSPANKLRKLRFKLVPKMLAMLTEIRQHLAFTRFEIEIGGRFPTDKYAALITQVNNIFNYMSLIDYATATYATARRPDGSYHVGKENASVADAADAAAKSSSSSSPSPGADGDEACHGPDMRSAGWLADLARVRRHIDLTTEEVTSLLALLAASLGNAQPLPPFLRPPRAYLLTSRIREIDPDVLSVRHVTEPGYAAFAVTQVASRLISADMAKLLANVRALVGELDFAYHPAEDEALKMGEKAQKTKSKTE